MWPLLSPLVKSLLVALIAWTPFWSPADAQGAEPPLTNTLKDWRTIRFVLRVDGGDYHPPAPFILLQRMEADRIVLSTGENDFHAETLPVARAIVTTETAQALIDRALVFYTRAQKESGEKARVHALPAAERDAIYRKAGFGISAAYIRIEILGARRSYQYEDDFADGSAALNEFGDFIMQQSK